MLIAQNNFDTTQSITDTSIHFPTWDELSRVLTLRDYNTRVVLLGTTVLGLSAGIIGTFMLLRRRALMADALSHATLPGIGIAFIVMVSWGGSGKYLPGLLLGAALSGAVGLGCVLLIRHFTRLKEDAALGIVLSVFFGLGISIFGVIQKMGTGQAAGLESFIYGKTASMLASDATLITIAGLIIAGACVMMFKEFNLLCFDHQYASAQGWPIVRLDIFMLILVVLVTVIGLQAVGLILMIALLVIPPAAARFWTHHLPTMVIISACIGALSGFVGAGISALVPRLPAGAIIVVVSGGIFAFSMIFGSARGVLVRWMDQMRIQRKVRQQHLMRALFEQSESETSAPNQPRRGIPFKQLLSERSWSPLVLRKQLSRATDQNLIRKDAGGGYCLTESGWLEARRVVRNHRLWELYLITHADIAPSHVDRDADQLEHVIGKTMVEKLEQMLAVQHPHLAMPPSPHQLD